MARKDALLEVLNAEVETARKDFERAEVEYKATLQARDRYVQAKEQAAERRGKKVTAAE